MTGELEMKMGPGKVEGSAQNIGQKKGLPFELSPAQAGFHHRAQSGL